MTTVWLFSWMRPFVKIKTVFSFQSFGTLTTLKIILERLCLMSWLFMFFQLIRISECFRAFAALMDKLFDMKAFDMVVKRFACFCFLSTKGAGSLEKVCSVMSLHVFFKFTFAAKPFWALWTLESRVFTVNLVIVTQQIAMTAVRFITRVAMNFSVVIHWNFWHRMFPGVLYKNWACKLNCSQFSQNNFHFPKILAILISPGWKLAPRIPKTWPTHSGQLRISQVVWKKF